MKTKIRDIEIKLKLLNHIAKKNNQSQRSISQELNVALGFANSLIKKFLKKGLLKLSQAPFRRYSYYVTPNGFLEKARLVTDFVGSSLDFYKNAKSEYEKELKNIKNKKIIFVGISELTEIAILVSNIHDIKIEAIYEENSKIKNFCKVNVVSDLKKIKKEETHFLLTTSKKINKNIQKIKNYGFDVFVPKFLLHE